MSFGASKKNASAAVRSAAARMGRYISGNGLKPMVGNPASRVSYRNDDNGKSKAITTLKDLARGGR